MQYNPTTKGLSITVKDADAAASSLLSAIFYSRQVQGMPLEGSPNGPPTGDTTCEYCILNAATALGIDLGATRPGVLDVRKYA